MTMVERHAELVYAESLAEKVRRIFLKMSYADAVKGAPWNRILGRLARFHQGSVSLHVYRSYNVTNTQS